MLDNAGSDRMTLAALGGLAALAIAMGIGRFAFTPLLPMMQSDAGVTMVQGGWLASANYVGYLLGGLSAVAMRLSPSRAIHIGLAIVGLSTLAMGFSSHMATWLVLRTLAGIASAWVLVFASAWCLDRFQAVPSRSRQAFLSATVFSGVGIGIAIAGVACVAVSIVHATSALAWIVLGILSLAGSIAIWNIFEPMPAAPASHAEGRLSWNAETARFVMSYGAFGFGYIIPATFLSAMARDAASNPAIYGWSWPAFGAAAAASTFAAALLRRRLADRWIWTAGHIAMAAGVVVPLAWHGLGGIVASALLVGGTFMVVTMVGMQEARRIAGSHSRALIAAMTSAFAAGQIAGPLVVSALAARGAGFAPALCIAGAVLVLSAVALIPIASLTRSP
jgi:predicted MFS family arabinose efflux permease